MVFQTQEHFSRGRQFKVRRKFGRLGANLHLGQAHLLNIQILGGHFTFRSEIGRHWYGKTACSEEGSPGSLSLCRQLAVPL